MPQSTNGAPPNSESSKEAALDAFAGLSEDDLNDLPQAARDAIKKSKEQFATLQTTAQQAEEKRAAAEKFARTQQGRADQLDSVVRKHNLPVDGRQSQAASQNPEYDALVAQFKADGLSDDQSAAYAKMFASANKISERRILQQLSPLAETVGSIQADTALAQASLQHSKLFAIPEVAKSVRDNVAAMSAQGQVITPEIITNLVDMSYGTFIRMNPNAIAPKDQQQTPGLGGLNMNQGGLPNNPTRKDASGAPIATQPETVKAMAGILGFLNQGLKTKK